MRDSVMQGIFAPIQKFFGRHSVETADRARFRRERLDRAKGHSRSPAFRPAFAFRAGSVQSPTPSIVLKPLGVH